MLIHTLELVIYALILILQENTIQLLNSSPLFMIIQKVFVKTPICNYILKNCTHWQVYFYEKCFPQHMKVRPALL